MSAALKLPDFDLSNHSAPALTLSEGQYRHVVQTLQSLTGIALGSHKQTLVQSRLQKRVRDLGLPDFDAYCSQVGIHMDMPERQNFIDALTTNLTKFFRESHHFKHLVEHVLKPNLPRVRSGGRIRIWSAGCSTGEEAVSVAMLLESVLTDARNRDVRVLASDIDTSVLRRAIQGLYSNTDVAAVPEALRSRFFKPSGDETGTHILDARVQGLIRYRLLNLNAPNWPFRGTFDAVMCRNTLIYFDDDAQDKLLRRLHQQIVPGGYLYIGHSERLIGKSSSLFEQVGTTTYRALHS